jgi:hypothetical protein
MALRYCTHRTPWSALAAALDSALPRSVHPPAAGHVVGAHPPPPRLAHAVHGRWGGRARKSTASVVSLGCCASGRRGRAASRWRVGAGGQRGLRRRLWPWRYAAMRATASRGTPRGALRRVVSRQDSPPAAARLWRGRWGPGAEPSSAWGAHEKKSRHASETRLASSRCGPTPKHCGRRSPSSGTR